MAKEYFQEPVQSATGCSNICEREI